MESKLLYGVAYYDEYMHEERLERDMQMMVKAGINVIRIAESTWSTEEPEDGIFDFSHVTGVIEAAAKYGISVIVGTPTYAIPPWLAHKCPEVIAKTEDGQGKYGARQNMDITHPVYLFHAERIIRKLMETVSSYQNVIGFQLDNETKHYHTAGPGVQKRFVQYLENKFGTVDALNEEFGFAYWSNSVDSFEHVPDVTGTINGSFFAEFEKFRRELVTEFLIWQRKIVDEYRRPDQFVTHNFDYEWREFSFGVQPDVNHFDASEAVTLSGCDIYHKSQDDLTGKEAAFCGAIARSLKKDNYLVLETQAQGHIGWTPYDGQLRMQAYSHIANGACGVMYWHWHSIHNSFETYWRGLLSHDMEENRPYREAMTIGADFEKYKNRLCGLKKKNKVAILVSNESLTALSKLPMFPLPGGTVAYNDIVRLYADALYDINLEYDIVSDRDRDFSSYDLLIVPALYSAPDSLLEAMNKYVKEGGHMIVTFKSAYANEYLTVSQDMKPHLIHEALGISYQEYTVPVKVSLEKTGNFWSNKNGAGEAAEVWMEFVEPKDENTEVLARYVHPCWKQFAAVTKHDFGEGSAIYMGCMASPDFVKELLRDAAKDIGMSLYGQELEFPLNIKNAVNTQAKNIKFVFNYSREEKRFSNPFGKSYNILDDTWIEDGAEIEVQPWGVVILECGGKIDG